MDLEDTDRFCVLFYVTVDVTPSPRAAAWRRPQQDACWGPDTSTPRRLGERPGPVRVRSGQGTRERTGLGVRRRALPALLRPGSRRPSAGATSGRHQTPV